MHSYDLILTLTGGLAAALVLGYLTQRLGLSPIVGYLLAGTLVGPHTPGLRRRRRARRAARRDRRHPADVRRRPAVPRRGAAGGAAGRRSRARSRRARSPPCSARCSRAAFGWDWSAGVVFGMALAVASTVVLVRVLADNNDLHTPGRSHRGRLAGGRGPVHRARAGAAAGAVRARRRPARRCGWRSVLTAVKVAALVAFTAVVGTRVIPRLLDYVARHAVARAVHADRPGDRARHRRRLGAGLQRVDGARRVSRRDGRRAIRLQPAGRVGSAADARRLRGAVLRVGRHAARPAVRCSRRRAWSPARWPSC